MEDYQFGDVDGSWSEMWFVDLALMSDWLRISYNSAPSLWCARQVTSLCHNLLLEFGFSCTCEIRENLFALAKLYWTSDLWQIWGMDCENLMLMSRDLLDNHLADVVSYCRTWLRGGYDIVCWKCLRDDAIRLNYIVGNWYWLVPYDTKRGPSWSHVSVCANGHHLRPRSTAVLLELCWLIGWLIYLTSVSAQKRLYRWSVTY